MAVTMAPWWDFIPKCLEAGGKILEKSIEIQAGVVELDTSTEWGKYHYGHYKHQPALEHCSTGPWMAEPPAMDLCFTINFYCGRKKSCTTLDKTPMVAFLSPSSVQCFFVGSLVGFRKNLSGYHSNKLDFPPFTREVVLWMLGKMFPQEAS